MKARKIEENMKTAVNTAVLTKNGLMWSKTANEALNKTIWKTAIACLPSDQQWNFTTFKKHNFSITKN